MQVIRLTGLALLALCAVCAGWSMALTLSERVRALELAEAVLDAFSSELSYSLAPPDEILFRLRERETLEKACYLSSCGTLCRQGQPFPKAWRQAVLETPGGLSKEDADMLASLSDTLGRCPLPEELAALDRVRGLLSVSLDEAREYARSHGKLYRTLGMLSGAFLVILLL